MNTSNSNVIIAGIINTTTGELTRTLSTQKGKTENRLYVRDVLNKEHGDYAFMTFEFRAWDADISFIKRHMVSKEPALIIELEILQCHFNIAQANNDIVNQKREIETAEEAVDECSCFYSTLPKALFKSSRAKSQFITDAADEDIQELKSELSSKQTRKTFLVKRLKDLTAKAQATDSTK
jgi:cell division protein FtsL